MKKKAVSQKYTISPKVLRWCGGLLCLTAIIWATWWARYYRGYFEDVPRLTEATRLRARTLRFPVIPGVLVLSAVYSFSVLAEKKRSDQWLLVVAAQLFISSVLSPMVMIKFVRLFLL